MANSSLFSASSNFTLNSSSNSANTALTFNEAGGTAYHFSPRHALAQYAMTGCLNQTFYAAAEDQLSHVLALASHADIDDGFLAKTAVYARKRGMMKDMPALLCAVLAARKSPLLETVFLNVIDNVKMLRNFVQIVRSGVTGRRSFGSSVRRLIRKWLEQRTDEQLFNASIGNDPSLADIIKMVHPRPCSPEREAMYRYLLGMETDMALLPETVRQFESLKAGETSEVPDIPFQFLTSLELTAEQWIQIARNASWQTTRMNLNTFARHGVFGSCGSGEQPISEIIAERLRERSDIFRARAFPYQLMAAYLNCGKSVPSTVRDALQDALEIATENVPTLEGRVAVCVDVSGSMSSPVSGWRRGSASKVRCVDVAALMASCILRNDPEAVIVPFECEVRSLSLDPRDTVLTNAEKLAELYGGGTNCSSALQYLLDEKVYPDVVIFVSDNESWMDSGDDLAGKTETLRLWDELKKKNPSAKLVNIDIQPYGTTQTMDREDIANVGGFSDAVFDFVANFVSASSAEHWVEVIEKTVL